MTWLLRNFTLFCNPLLGPDFTLSTIALILSILDWLATTILLPQMLFSNFDFLQQNFAVISKTFLDNSDSATVSVLSHSGPARTMLHSVFYWNFCLHWSIFHAVTFTMQPILGSRILIQYTIVDLSRKLPKSLWFLFRILLRTAYVHLHYIAFD